MKKATLIHPRKLTRVMEEFLAKVMEVENLTRTVEYYSFDSFDRFMSGEEVEPEYGEEYVTPKLHCRKGCKNFCVYSYDFFEDTDSLIIEFDYDPNVLLSNRSRDYRDDVGFIMADMGRRANYMKGFSQAVRILLHELGHVMTHEEVMEKYGEDTLAEMRMNNHNSNKGNRGYVRLPDEYAATQWAIDWLADPDHRKIARDFEKKFWACFA